MSLDQSIPYVRYEEILFKFFRTISIHIILYTNIFGTISNLLIWSFSKLYLTGYATKCSISSHWTGVSIVRWMISSYLVSTVQQDTVSPLFDHLKNMQYSNTVRYSFYQSTVSHMSRYLISDYLPRVPETSTMQYNNTVYCPFIAIDLLLFIKNYYRLIASPVSIESRKESFLW